MSGVAGEYMSVVQNMFSSINALVIVGVLSTG